jgi:protein-disulfide isomerase
MKTTLYSSTFLTLILAFLMLLGQSGETVAVVQDGPHPSFQTIIEPIGPAFQDSDGKVTLEVFNTFGCQDCDNFGIGTLPALREKYAEDPAVDFHLYMIPDMENAGELSAARGAYCAANYERFWDMVTELHRLETLSSREVDIAGQGLNLPVLEFRNCIQNDVFDEQIASDVNYAQQKGVISIPTILVNGTVMMGAQPIENIEREVNKYLTQ